MVVSFVLACADCEAGPIPLESPAGAYYLAREDLIRQPAAVRPFVRYLALYAQPPDRRDGMAKAISFISNSLSWRKAMVHPVVVGDGLLIRISLFDFEWDERSRAGRIADAARVGVDLTGRVSADPWETLTVKDPYFRANQLVKVNRNGRSYEKLFRGWIDPDVYADVNRMARSRGAVLRADWWLVQVSVDRPVGFYSDFLMLPAREADLYKLLLIDEKTARRRSLTVGGATQAGQSYVAFNPRELELLRGEYGDLWRTYDFDINKVINDVNGLKNPRRQFRGTVAHDGREIIWELPNGLHAYILMNGAGDQVAEVPPTIAQDRRNDPFRQPKDRVVRNAYKCVDCHGPSDGIIPFRDSITGQIVAERNALATISEHGDALAAEREARKVTDYYLEHFASRMDAERKAYRGAIDDCNGLEPADNSKNYMDFYESYVYSPLDRSQAVRELGWTGIDEETADEYLKASFNADLLAMRKQVNQLASRAQFEAAFRAGMQGIRAYPWELRQSEENHK
jgi:hypothetical protein